MSCRALPTPSTKATSHRSRLTTTFRILSGSLSGRTFTPVREDFLAGRHPEADLRFDAERDLSVSARHAQFRRSGVHWYVRDLDSRNGTRLNGELVQRETRLKDGDRVQLGESGPVLEVRLTAAGSGPGPVSGARESTTQRVRVAVSREMRRIRWVVGSLVTVLIVLFAALVVADKRERTAWAQERQRLEQRIDSLLQASSRTAASLQGEVSGLDAALQASEQRLRQLRAELGRAPPRGDDNTEALRRQLLSASSALRRQQLAASLDFELIQRRNRAAVAMLWVEYADGTRATGTAFAVAADGVVITNRHLITGPDGQHELRRAAVRFADSEQAFPATLAAVSRDWDLAALRVQNLLGTVPTVAAANLRSDTIAAGSPVALIGFPLGGEPDRDPLLSSRVARPVISAALVVHSDGDRFTVQGLGAAGASGSPILDGRGELVGVLFGGGGEAGIQVLQAVPAGAVADLMSRLR
ncbi:MAG TPA: trypsin-like peptidase domain-containing protein [Longimicrobiales bacterium]|nr:trypsin-like peptidase domain-containing protein [Longimicrobiales bacterium]